MTVCANGIARGALLLAIGSIATSSVSQKPEVRTASEVAAHLSRESGVAVYLDSRVARERSPMPSSGMQITADNVQDHLARLVKSLPAGATWAKVYLPPPSKGRVWQGDDVVGFVRAQARLYGKVGTYRAATVEVLSQQLSHEEAKGVISTLGLKPVYVIALGRGTFAGVWQTSYGEMRLQQTGDRVTGTYTSGDGEVQGFLSGDVLNLRWYERGSGRGGPARFVLSEDGDSFAGTWAYDESADSPGAWTGARVSRR